VQFDVGLLLPRILFGKYIYILASKMAIAGNQHCASCIGTLSFPIAGQFGSDQRMCCEQISSVGDVTPSDHRRL